MPLTCQAVDQQFHAKLRRYFINHQPSYIMFAPEYVSSYGAQTGKMQFMDHYVLAPEYQACNTTLSRRSSGWEHRLPG